MVHTRTAVRGRRSLVEHERLGLGPLAYRALEDAFGPPELKDALFLGGRSLAGAEDGKFALFHLQPLHHSNNEAAKGWLRPSGHGEDARDVGRLERIGK